MVRISLVPLVLGLTSITAAACSGGVSPLRSGGVEVQVFSGGVVVANARSDSIGRFVVDQATLARILWVPCVGEPHCTWIQPGEAESFREEDVIGWKESNTLVVFWWHAVPTQGGGFAPDSVRRIQVDY